jgi:pimeloyl-ACP methyl ester carboxylesterase
MVTVPGAKLAVWSRGRGPAIVLMHGGTGTASHDWGHLMPALADCGRVVAMDLRGHGASVDAEFDLGTTRFGMDAAHVMSALGMPRAVLIGFSVGANSVLDLLSRRPWIAHAAILLGASANGSPERVMDIMNGPWPRELRTLKHDNARGDPDHWQRIRGVLARDWAENVRFIETGLEMVACPVTIIHGADDPIVLPEQASRLHAAIPDSRLVEIPNTGHQVHREAPAVFMEIVTDVLESLPGQG